jgi:hypothetical protein
MTKRSRNKREKDTVVHEQNFGRLTVKVMKLGGSETYTIDLYDANQGDRNISTLAPFFSLESAKAAIPDYVKRESEFLKP